MENMHGTIKQKCMIFLLEIMKMVVLKEYGGEYEECFVGNENCNDDILCDINMCRLEFVDIFEKIGGKVITNLNDYIRYKYNNY